MIVYYMKLNNVVPGNQRNCEGKWLTFFTECCWSSGVFTVSLPGDSGGGAPAHRLSLYLYLHADFDRICRYFSVIRAGAAGCLSREVPEPPVSVRRGHERRWETFRRRPRAPDRPQSRRWRSSSAAGSLARRVSGPLRVFLGRKRWKIKKKKSPLAAVCARAPAPSSPASDVTTANRTPRRNLKHTHSHIYTRIQWCAKTMIFYSV